MIRGQHFLGVKAIDFNGVACSDFVVNAPTRITARVPAGAGTGPVGVATSAGETRSAKSLTVLTHAGAAEAEEP